MLTMSIEFNQLEKKKKKTWKIVGSSCNCLNHAHKVKE